MDDIDKMSGLEFEKFLAKLFAKMGYTNITLTPATDQGGDLICEAPNGVRSVIQAKRWKSSVGNSSIQEVLGAMAIYECRMGMVVTNSNFTKKAIILAKKTRILLHDRTWLAKQIKAFIPSEIPDFTWEEYKKIFGF